MSSPKAPVSTVPNSHLKPAVAFDPLRKRNLKKVLLVYIFKNQAIMYVWVTGALGQFCAIINHFIVYANGN